jgi:hypothetical protein
MREDSQTGASLLGHPGVMLNVVGKFVVLNAVDFAAILAEQS